jgi:hypothetical protein
VARINLKRVVIGGLLAGLIIDISESILNIPVFGTQMEAAMKALNLPPVGMGPVGVFLVGAHRLPYFGLAPSFPLGLTLVWLCAAIRPRFGEGPRTAIIAAIVLWFLAYFWPSLGLGLMGFMPMKLLLVAVAWGLVEVIIAALAGGAVYKEA